MRRNYFDVCGGLGQAHVYNHWSYMPPLAEQHKRMGTFTAPFTVLRLLTPLKIYYEAAKTGRSVELARGIEPATCGLRIPDPANWTDARPPHKQRHSDEL